MDIDVENYRRVLTSRRAELLTLIEAASDSAAPVELDQ